MRQWSGWFIVLASLGLAAGAAWADTASRQDSTVAACRTLFYDLDAAIVTNGVRDQGPYPVKGFSYLRLNRFLASFRTEVKDTVSFQSWVDALGELDQRARALELRNLPAEVRRHFGPDPVRHLARCRGHLIATDLNTSSQRERLVRSAWVPDEYEGGLRLLGLYPISALFVNLGVERWQAESRAQLRLAPIQERTDAEEWWRSGGEVTPDDGLTATGIARILSESRDSLGIPRPETVELRRLFEHFAPSWGLEPAGADDRIGRPQWQGARMIIETKHPVEYHRTSYTRIEGRTLLQLNYVIWFPARSGDDIYAGAIDGINWRLTLDDDGRPLISDVIHNCGCYQTYFPTRRLRLRSALSRAYLEAPLVFPAHSEDGPPTILLASGTHLIRQVSWGEKRGAMRRLAVADYDELRSLPRANGRKSMFGHQGIVGGSERRERFLLWPMGVRSAGAMRQWGRHAIAFVGRRHFDDPYLFATLFRYRDGW